MAKFRRSTQAGVVSAQAGCMQCAGGNAQWYGKSAQGTAARHTDATGHQTWVESTMSVIYDNADNPLSSEQAISLLK
jgi:hypothetical protein